MAYRFLKTTVIIGYDTDEANPFGPAALGMSRTPDQMTASFAWSEKHLKSYSLRGHWSVEAIKAFAAKRNLRKVSAVHHENNMSKPGVLDSNKPVIL